MGLENKLLYTSLESVKVRLFGKVQFQSEGERLEQGEISNELLLQIISDSETEVEQDLRGRYAIPFRSIRTGDFQSLPNHTKRAIRQVVDYKAVVTILDTDFGRSGNANAGEYRDQMQRHYEQLMTKLMGRDEEASSVRIDRYRYTAPLEDLLLAPTNRTDNGLRGQVIVDRSRQNRGIEYAAFQQNDPSRGWVEGFWFDESIWRE